jgi:hypothetical protein
LSKSHNGRGSTGDVEVFAASMWPARSTTWSPWTGRGAGWWYLVLANRNVAEEPASCTGGGVDPAPAAGRFAAGCGLPRGVMGTTVSTGAM